MENEAYPVKIGLALSGGGARGLAHIGALKVLAEAQIGIDYLAGTSMGGIIAALFAAGLDPIEMEDRALQLARVRQLIRLVDLKPPRRGLLEGGRVRAYLSEMIDPDQTFESLRIPLVLNAVDLLTAREIVLREGPLLPAVMATSAMPGLFPPVELGPYRLVDGGVLNNLPVNLVRRMGANLVIAVNVQLEPSKEPPWQDLPLRPGWARPLPDLFLDFYRVELIMVEALTYHQLRSAAPDVYIHPALSTDLTEFLGFTRAAEAIAAGEEAARQALPEIRRVMDQMGSRNSLGHWLPPR